MKISFDFDGTLELDTVQDFAKKFIESGHDVCILTTRYKKYVNADVWKVARKLGIEEIHFTDWTWKYKKIDLLGIDLHFDDYEPEISWINDYSKAVAMPVEYIRGHVKDKEDTEDYYEL